jgi:hypothetical protein
VIDWLIDYCFTSRSRFFNFNGDVTIAGEGLQNVYARRSGPLSMEGSLSCYTCCNMVSTGFSGLIPRTAPFSRLLRHTKGMRNIYSNPYSHGLWLVCYYQCFSDIFYVFIIHMACPYNKVNNRPGLLVLTPSVLQASVSHPGDRWDI